MTTTEKTIKKYDDGPDILTQIDQRRENIAATARQYLNKLKFDYPEIQFLTLNIKHKYGFSSLRVYTLKEKEAEHSVDPDAEPDDSLIENPFS